MTRVLCLLAVGVATAAVAAPVPKSLRKKPDYFPTPLGGVWTYGTGEDPTRHSIHISDVQTAPGETTVVRRYQMGNSEGPLDVCRVSSGEVRQVRRSSHDTAIDRLFLRPSLKPGDTWKSEYQLAEILDVRETFTVGEPQRVTVPAGTFRAVPVTSQRMSNGGAVADTTVDWYAAGVGLVKSKSQTGTVKELVKFTPGR